MEGRVDAEYILDWSFEGVGSARHLVHWRVGLVRDTCGESEGESEKTCAEDVTVTRTTVAPPSSTRTTAIHDGMPHRIFKITELTRLIAGHLLLTTCQKSAVSLACACRYLEEPVLSTLWETQHSFCILLEVLPKETWELERRPTEYVVRDLVLPLEKLNACAYGYFRSKSWGVRRQRIGVESDVMRLGYANSTWTSGPPVWSPANSAATHLLVGGSQRCRV